MFSSVRIYHTIKLITFELVNGHQIQFAQKGQEKLQSVMSRSKLIKTEAKLCELKIVEEDLHTNKVKVQNAESSELSMPMYDPSICFPTLCRSISPPNCADLQK